MDRSTFVAFLAEDVEPSRGKPVTSNSLERASPTNLSTKQDKMVQVSNFPDFDEEKPIVPQSDSQNVPDDVKTSRITNEAYKILNSAMMADPIPPTNADVALNLLETALRNRNVSIAKHCIENLSQLIKKDNALKILTSISRWIYMPEADQQLNFEPSAPPLADNDDERNDDWMKIPLNRLRDNILLEIDKQGDFFLKQKEIEDLHYQDLLAITTRDSLQVSSELIVYGAMMRWTTQECHRKGMAIEDVNIRAVLKDLIFAPRYGLMTKKEFRTRTVEGHKGPDRIGIPSDINEQILNHILQKDKKRKVEQLPLNMSKPRQTNNNKKSEIQPTREKVIINCLTCFSAVFD